MKTKSMILITGVLLLAIVLSACASSPTGQSTSSTPPPRTITVNGSGKAFLTPDIAYISIGVHTEDPDAAKAVASNNAQSQKVADALKEKGVDPKDIQTTNFSIYPQQKFDEQGKPVGTYYAVDNTVYVTVRDLSKLGELLNAVVSSGANSISGIQFDVENKDQALSDARQAAVSDAQLKAEQLAKAAGVTLGPVQTITEYSAVPVPVYEGKGGGAATEAAVNVPIAPGQLTLTVEVNVVYGIK